MAATYYRELRSGELDGRAVAGHTRFCDLRHGIRAGHTSFCDLRYGIFILSALFYLPIFYGYVSSLTSSSQLHVTQRKCKLNSFSVDRERPYHVPVCCSSAPCCSAVPRRTPTLACGDREVQLRPPHRGAISPSSFNPHARTS